MKISSLKTNRLVWADLIRVVAIVLVVVVHTFRLTGPINEVLPSLAFFTFAKNCIPLFVMISGALLLSKKETLAVFFSKRVKRVLVPWLFWAVIYSLIFFASGAPSYLELLKEFFVIFTAKFTFLPLIFCLYLIMPLLRVIAQNSKPWLSWYLVGLWFLGISLLPYFRNSLAFPLSVDNGLVRQTVEFSGFLVLGHLLAKIKVDNKKLFLVGIGFLIAWAGSIFLTIGGENLNLVFTNYIAPLVIFSSALIFLLLKNWGEKKYVKTFSNTLAMLSRASFGVFLIHPLLIELFGNQLFFKNEALLTANTLRFSIILVASYATILLLSTNKNLKRLIT